MSDWWAFLAFYESVLVWPLAIAVVVLFAITRSLRGRVISACLLALVFLPHLQVAIGNVYFDYLCRTQAGEFIYRTVDNVEGILQMRPRDGSKDYFDRMRAGDIPEDPYGHTNWEAQRPATMFVDPPWAKYRFYETPIHAETNGYATQIKNLVEGISETGAAYYRFSGRNQKLKRPMILERVVSPKSKYGYTWGGTQRLDYWFFNVYRGDIRVVDLTNGEALARLTGFVSVRPFAGCPAGKDDKLVYTFVTKVARPGPLVETPALGETK